MAHFFSKIILPNKKYHNFAAVDWTVFYVAARSKVVVMLIFLSYLQAARAR